MPDPATIAEADRDLALKMSEMEDAQRAYDRVKDGPNAGDVAAAQAKVDCGSGYRQFNEHYCPLRWTGSING